MVKAKHILVATKIPPYPLAARLTYAAIEYPHTSYIVAGTTDSSLKGMYISPDKGQYSLLPVDTPEGRLLLVGGENHVPGLSRPGRHYRKLADYAHHWFGVHAISHRWRAMDYMAYDNVPVVGPLYPWSKHIYVATGFKKWGLSTSMVAAHIIRGYLTGTTLPHSRLFYPHRVSALRAMPRRAAQELTRLDRLG